MTEQDNITQDDGPLFRIILVTEEDTIKGVYGADSSNEVAQAVKVLAETHAMDSDLHLEVRQ